MSSIRHILGVGPYTDHNRWRAEAFRQLGVQCTYIPTQQYSRAAFALEHRVGLAPHRQRVVRQIARAIEDARPDAIWVDKGLMFGPDDVEAWRARCRVVAHYHPDDWQNPLYHWHPFRLAIPHYDVHFVTRPANVAELYLLGAAHVVKTWFAYEPSVHRPVFGNAVISANVFLGRADHDRVELLTELARLGLPVRAYGFGYDAVEGAGGEVLQIQPLRAEYAGVVESATAALGLVARQSRDQHTCRSVEIPACRGVLVAERTPEHEDLFDDGREALFFDSTAQLVDHLDRLGKDAEFNEKVRAAGHHRATHSGYDHIARAREALRFLEDAARGG
jgi:spore maturation protein CgeB